MGKNDEGTKGQKTEVAQRTNSKELLNDQDIRRWYNNNRKGSMIRADVYVRCVSRFCFNYARMHPVSFAKLSLEEMENMVADFADFMEAATNPKTGQKYAPSYIDGYVKAIRSWAEWNKKTFTRKIKISNLTKTPTLLSERVPTPDELAKVLYADTTPQRTRASIAIMAFSGARPQVQGNYEGNDGIRIKDFPELQILTEGERQTEVMFAKIPTIVMVKDELSKSRRKYLTFFARKVVRF